MDIQAYSYTVLSSIIGMGIVFAFLGFLSLLMVFIKRVFDSPASPANAVKTKPADAVANANEAGRGSENSAEDNMWIIAAVAAFLEDEDMPKSAMAWQPAESEKHDPWVSVPGVQRQPSRVF